MEKFTAYIEYVNKEELERHLKKLCELANFKFFELHIIFAKPVSKKELSEVLEIEKDISFRTETVFSNCAIIKFNSGLRRFIKRLYAKGFCVELYLNDDTLIPLKKHRFRKTLNSRRGSYKLFIDSNGSPQAEYIKYSKIGLPLNFLNPDYSEDHREWFDKWAVSPNAVPINIFDQILRVILLADNTHNCAFNSCLGKNLYISSESVCSFCPKNPRESAMKASDIALANTFSEVFDDDGFISLLEVSLKRRESCLSACSEFAFCQGGCPLSSQGECISKNYVILVAHIKRFLYEVLESNDLSRYNYSIKDAVYTAMAFNSNFGTLNNEGSEK